MKSIYSMTINDLENFLLSKNQKKYRASQIMNWLYIKRVKSFNEMTNLSKDMRNQLSNCFYISNCQVNTKLVSQIDDTVKYLFVLPDGEYVESVVMKYKYGYSICISTQVGCKMGCTFCASAIGGFVKITANIIIRFVNGPAADIITFFHSKLLFLLPNSSKITAKPKGFISNFLGFSFSNSPASKCPHSCKNANNISTAYISSCFVK